MDIKIFGKSLFSARTRGEALFTHSLNVARESKYLPDFNKGVTGNNFLESYAVVQTSEGSAVAMPNSRLLKKVKVVKPDKRKMDIRLTPKGVYELKLLHDESFKLNTDPAYVDKQISDFKDKLGLIKAEEYDMRNGVEEIASIILRMENRKKYPEVSTFFEEYPYTTTAKINTVLKSNDYLKLGQVAQFVAELPTEAIETMKKYEEETVKLCAKKPVFYIVANKEDFKKTDKKRDPILLAQSPFGHFWQILGAWDKEMMLLENL